MDEEGTVVYFQTSPALRGREHQFSNELSFSETGTKENSNDASSSAAQKSVWKRLYFYGIATIRGLIPDCSQKEIESCHSIAKAIRDSPLLTEEDYQLLYFVLLKPHPQENVPKIQSQMSSTKSVLVVVLVALLAVCSTQFHCIMWTAVVAAVLLCTLYLSTQLMNQRHERRFQSARQRVSDYCSNMESLLSLLSHAIHTIQEAEIVTRGYGRLFPRVVGRMGGCQQCVGLHRVLFSVCQSVIGRLRSTTVSITQQYPLSRELDDGAPSYLSHSSIDSLHSCITTDLEAVSKEDADKHKCLSLESLKDAANLLAVQNSELLRHLAITLVIPTSGPGGCDHSGSSGPDGCDHSGSICPRGPALVRCLAGLLHSVIDTVSEERKRLEWSCDFHKNHLFGNPPSRPTFRESSGNRYSTTLSSVTELAREVHHMDLKTQAALHRIRDLGSQLTTAQDSEVTTTILKHGEQLSAIQRIVDAVSDHIEDGLNILQALQPPPNTLREGVMEEEADESAADGNTFVATPPSLEPRNEASSSEDEMVFEDYVPAMGEASDDGRVTDCSWRKREETGRDVGEKMMRELEDVLAVRSEKREREREERRRRRRERRGETRDDGDTRSQPEPLKSCNIRDSTPPQDVMCSHANQTLSISADKDLEENDDKDLEKDESTPLESQGTSEVVTPDIGLATQLAMRVATIAAHRKRAVKTEETFVYSDDSGSHSE